MGNILYSPENGVGDGGSGGRGNEHVIVKGHLILQVEKGVRDLGALANQQVSLGSPVDGWDLWWGQCPPRWFSRPAPGPF
ncbi:Hypothetical protein NTJ_11049 [Nesidiocoris tenuis]|uniref:Uncharacterized protein n=1 Tax=Nesidiocoris tenuis TaxID=355587 RepID=A0ABN7B3Q8_9HEMI|nr:Hypothetical protein NTJ_11049 [Nesidiocoris tenuis]